MKLMYFFQSKPSSSQTSLTAFYKYLATRFSEEKGGGILAYVADRLKVERITSLEETNLKPFGYKSIRTNQIVRYSQELFTACLHQLRTRMPD